MNESMQNLIIDLLNAAPDAGNPMIETIFDCLEYMYGDFVNCK
jgi:hypothetical protein